PGTDRGEHAVDAAVDRLRTALGVPDAVRTAAGECYRLAAEPAGDTEYGDGG
ncbi:uroporphyrinogen-III synthase, partial [Streptomyces sp. SID10853]|nr:uroporphyrinogen-III synthase [Streptomyces sp. SID10853]